jgi:coatomer protein complex subunit gamma
LKFQSRDVDPDTGVVGDVFDDEYPTEGIDVFVGDYVMGSYISGFDQIWDQLGNEVVETFMLPEMKTVENTVAQLSLQLGLKPAEGVKEAARTTVKMGGTAVGGINVLSKINMIVNPKEGVTMQVIVRSTDEDTSELVANGIQ